MTRQGPLLFTLIALLPAAALAQPAVMTEMKQRYQECLADGYVLEAEAAERLQRSLEIWKLNPDDLPDADRRHLLTLHLFSALGRGHAAGARVAWDALAAKFPDEAATQRLGYLVASANGDAPLAEQTLRDLSRQLDRAARRSLSRPRRAARQIGQEAPDVRIRTSDLAEYNPARPGAGCLVLHFWRRAEAAEQAPEDLARFAARMAEQRNVQMIGINADPEDAYEQAVAFARDRGYTWPQRYEGAAVKAPLTDEAFHVPRPGWLVVVDSYGYVRAIGDPDDPAVSYAVRAAAAEASDTVPRVLPTARDGSRPTVRTATPSAPPAPAAGAGQTERDDPEAEAKLRRARLMLRTGQRSAAKELLREIVSTAAGTIQARKASEILDGLP